MSPQEFSDLHAGLRRLRAQGFAGGAALATLVQTRGPVFRRAGARMLVCGDGSIVRGLSAGCPEADIIERSRAVIASGEARLLRYDREQGYDVMLELGCGGEMEILLAPLQHADDLRFADAVAEALQQRTDGLLFTVFAQGAHCLQRPRHLVWSRDVLLDELDDPALRSSLLAQYQNAEALPAVQLCELATASGALRVLIERLRPPLRLTLIGINTTTLALTRLGRSMGWQVCIVDHREDTPAPMLADDALFLRATPPQLRQRVELDARTAVVVMTHNLERDIDYLHALAAQPLAYLGALGSRVRAAKMHAAIGSGSVPLHAPAGLDIGSETPEEIALAIAAEIQAAVNGHAGGRLSAGDGPIH
ncbi:MAG TPA: XdhC family protein [Fontimonas sp.]